MVVGLNTVNIVDALSEPSFVGPTHLNLLGHLRREAAVRLWTTADTSLLSLSGPPELAAGASHQSSQGLAVTVDSVLPQRRSYNRVSVHSGWPRQEKDV